MSIRLDKVPALDRQTDGQTDRFAITISHFACISMLTREMTRQHAWM